MLLHHMWIYEVGNRLSKPKNTREEGTIEKLHFYRASFFTDVVSLRKKDIDTAFDLINTYKTISFYDASYHALALEEGGTFLTNDEKYYKKTKNAGGIMLLRDYG